MTADADEEALETEARLFGRYLVGREPAVELVARYRDACRALWPNTTGGAGAARLAFLRRHPWAVGPLDAASALLDPGGPVRSRILVFAAILETTPAHAEAFLPANPTLPRLLTTLVLAGIAAVAKALAGFVLWPIAGRGAA